MPPRPREGEMPPVGYIQGNWRWTGNNWEPHGSGGSNTGEFGLDKILDEFKKRQEERNRLTTEFETKNPFVFDEVLAKKALQASNN